MNTVEINNTVRETEAVESTTIPALAALRQSSTKAIWQTRLRYALLVVIALFLTWSTLSIRHTMNIIGADIEMTSPRTVAWHF